MRWLRYLLSALIGMLIAFGILVPAASILAPAVGRQVLAIRGGSMSPAIPVGSAIVVSERDPADLRTGDIVTWRSETGVLVTHRVLQIVEENGELFFQTQGDANDSPDPSAVPADAIVGIVEMSVPAAGYGLIIMSTPTGLVSWLSFGLALLATDTLVAGMGTDTQPVPAPAQRPAVERADLRERLLRVRERMLGIRERLWRRIREPRGTGWPVHFEGVTVLGTDLAILDDMLRCANGDHRSCVTEVRPRACAVSPPEWPMREVDRCVASAS